MIESFLANSLDGMMKQLKTKKMEFKSNRSIDVRNKAHEYSPWNKKEDQDPI